MKCPECVSKKDPSPGEIQVYMLIPITAPLGKAATIKLTGSPVTQPIIRDMWKDQEDKYCFCPKCSTHFYHVKGKTPPLLSCKPPTLRYAYKPETGFGQVIDFESTCEGPAYVPEVEKKKRSVLIDVDSIGGLPESSDCDDDDDTDVIDDSLQENYA